MLLGHLVFAFLFFSGFCAPGQVPLFEFLEISWLRVVGGVGFVIHRGCKSTVFRAGLLWGEIPMFPRLSGPFDCHT